MAIPRRLLQLRWNHTPSRAPVQTSFPLPGRLREKLGVNLNPRVATYRGGQLTREDVHLLRRVSVFDNFVRSCDHSEYRGIACHAQAFISAHQALPPDESAQFRFGSRRKGRWQFVQRPSFDERDKTMMVFRPPYLKNVRCNISGIQSGHVVIARCRPSLVAGCHLKQLPLLNLSQADIAVPEEMEQLADVAAMVVRRFCAEMVFDSHEQAASTLAEALLHVLQFRSPILSLDEVKLGIDFQDAANAPSTSLQALAKWKHAGQDLTETGSELKEVEVVVENPAAEVNADENDDNCEPEEEASGASSCSATAEVEPSQDLPRSSKFNESILPLLKMAEGSSRKVVLADWSDESLRSMPGSMGMTLSTVTLVWDKERTSALGHFSSADLTRLAGGAISDVSAKGFYAATHIAGGLMKTVPGNPIVALKFHRRVSEGTVEIAVTASSREAQEMRSISMPPMKWPKFHINDDLPQQPEYLRLGITLVAPKLSKWTTADNDVPTVSLQVFDFLRDRIAPLIESQSAQTIEDLASKIAAVLAQIPQPIAGMLHCRSLRVCLAVIANDMAIKKAEATSRFVRNTKENKDIYVALGSNLGDRFAAIETACRKIDEDNEMQIVATSGLFETDPMYVQDQNRFLNGVCKVNTELAPIQLLDKLQAIENNLGRVKIIDKGPRNIDLDIVAYGQRKVDTDRLTVPHRLMLEREFVLRPLSDIARTYLHPVTKREMSWHLAQLPPSPTPMYPLTPLAPGRDPLRSVDPKRKTLVMSILNVTPDSFSDGGANQSTDVGALKTTVASHIAAGAAIIDIGGQSSRPNAPDVTAEEEISRILPAIDAIKSLPEASEIAISIDTYRASVAEAAINAGAHIINDISAGLLDPEMLPTIARLGCTYIMMHMRGTPHTMQSDENTSYPDGVVKTVGGELRLRLAAAQEAGIRRWRIILDPGVGFAKTTEQNLQILCNFRKLRNQQDFKTLPWLVGTSRKGFIGKITEVEKASDRVAGTAATVTAAVAGGAEIVRVHDVQEMVRVVKMADAMYRVAPKEALK